MPRTLLLALDGLSPGDLAILTRDNGRGPVMPFLGGLADKGFSAPLDAGLHARPAAVWGSLLTGRLPGSHGIFDGWRILDKRLEVQRLPVDHRELQVETVLSLAARQGCAIAGLNIPLTPPAEENLPPADFPWEGDEPASTDKQCALPAALAAGEDRLCSLARWKLDRGGHDILMLRLGGPARLPGAAWQGLGADQPDCMTEALLRYFAGLDRRIRYLAGAAGGDTRLLVLSTHGTAPAATVVRINSLLARLGHLVRTGEASGTDPVQGCDWRQTRAWLPWSGSNGVAVRVAKDREGPGIDPHGYETFRAGLVRECLSLKKKNGEPAITAAYLREEVFPGHCLGQALDLLLAPQAGTRLTAGLEGEVVEDSETVSRVFTPGGFLLASGPDIRTGREDTPVNARDVAPLLLHLAGLPIPEDLEGAVPEQCLDRAWLESTPVTVGQPTLPVLDGRIMDTAGEENEEAVKERLKALGYL